MGAGLCLPDIYWRESDAGKLMTAILVIFVIEMALILVAAVIELWTNG